MKFSLFSIVALLGATAAASSGKASEGFQIKVKRQTRPAVSAPVMADANGNVVPYNTNGVVQNKAKLKAKRMAAAQQQAK